MKGRFHPGSSKDATKRGGIYGAYIWGEGGTRRKDSCARVRMQQVPMVQRGEYTKASRPLEGTKGRKTSRQPGGSLVPQGNSVPLKASN